MANYITGFNDVLVNNANRWEAHADEQTSYYWSVTGTQGTDWVEVSQGNTHYFYDVKFLNSGSYTISCYLTDLGLIVEKDIHVYGKLDKVPNTNTFSLKDVCNVILDSLYGNLNNCFSVSIADYFNTTYEGNKDRLSNFRDYDPSGGGGGGTSGTITLSENNVYFLATEYGSSVAVTIDVTTNPTSSFNITPTSDGIFYISKTSSSITVNPYSENTSNMSFSLTITAYYTDYTSDSVTVHQGERFLTE